jgi:hypothetical protein
MKLFACGFLFEWLDNRNLVTPLNDRFRPTGFGVPITIVYSPEFGLRAWIRMQASKGYAQLARTLAQYYEFLIASFLRPRQCN